MGERGEIRLLPGQWRALERSLHSPERIVVGQVGVSQEVAALFVQRGVWEKTVQEEIFRGLHWRYRLTDFGREMLALHQQRDAP